MPSGTETPPVVASQLPGSTAGPTFTRPTSGLTRLPGDQQYQRRRCGEGRDVPRRVVMAQRLAGVLRCQLEQSRVELGARLLPSADAVDRAPVGVRAPSELSPAQVTQHRQRELVQQVGVRVAVLGEDLAEVPHEAHVDVVEAVGFLADQTSCPRETDRATLEHSSGEPATELRVGPAELVLGMLSALAEHVLVALDDDEVGFGGGVPVGGDPVCRSGRVVQVAPLERCPLLGMRDIAERLYPDGGEDLYRQLAPTIEAELDKVGRSLTSLSNENGVYRLVDPKRAYALRVLLESGNPS